jgi:hypothetical protein
MVSQQPVHVVEHGHIAPPLTPSPVRQLPLPSQHPLGQVVGPHTNPPHVPPRQKAPLGQLTHEAPKLPHSVLVVPVWHVSLASQQPGHVYGLHGLVTHVAPWHTSV